MIFVSLGNDSCHKDMIKEQYMITGVEKSCEISKDLKTAYTYYLDNDSYVCSNETFSVGEILFMTSKPKSLQQTNNNVINNNITVPSNTSK